MRSGHSVKSLGAFSPMTMLGTGEVFHLYGWIVKYLYIINLHHPLFLACRIVDACLKIGGCFTWKEHFCCIFNGHLQKAGNIKPMCACVSSYSLKLVPDMPLYPWVGISQEHGWSWCWFWGGMALDQLWWEQNESTTFKCQKCSIKIKRSSFKFSEPESQTGQCYACRPSR